LIIEKAIKVLLFEKMEHYHNEMIKNREFAEKAVTLKDYHEGVMIQRGSQVCAMAETIGIIENTNEDTALAEFHEWLKSKEG